GDSCTAAKALFIRSPRYWSRYSSRDRARTPSGEITGTFARFVKVDSCPLPLPKLAHISRGLLQPVRHVHFAVHRRSDGKLVPSLRGIPSTATELAQAKVAMGNERTHAARFGEHQRLAVVAFSVLGAGCGGDVTVEAEGMGLVSPSPQPAREHLSLSGVAGCHVDPPGRETCQPRAQK